MSLKDRLSSPARSPGHTRMIIVSSGSDSDDLPADGYPSTPLRCIARCISWSNMDAAMSLSLDDDEQETTKTPVATPKRTPSKLSLEKVPSKKAGSKKLADLSTPSLNTENAEVSKKQTKTLKFAAKSKVTDKVNEVDTSMLTCDSTGSVTCQSPSPRRVVRTKQSSQPIGGSSPESKSCARPSQRSKPPLHRVAQKISLWRLKKCQSVDVVSSSGDFSCRDDDQSSDMNEASMVSERSRRGHSQGPSCSSGKSVPVETVSPHASSLCKPTKDGVTCPVSPHRSMNDHLDGRISPRRTVSSSGHPQTLERLASSLMTSQRVVSKVSHLKTLSTPLKGEQTLTYTIPSKMCMTNSTLKPTSILKDSTYANRHVVADESPGMVENLVEIFLNEKDSDSTYERAKYRSVKECLGEYDNIVNGCD